MTLEYWHNAKWQHSFKPNTKDICRWKQGHCICKHDKTPLKKPYFSINYEGKKFDSVINKIPFKKINRNKPNSNHLINISNEFDWWSVLTFYLIEIIKRSGWSCRSLKVAGSVPTQKTTRLPDFSPKHNYQRVKQIAKNCYHKLTRFWKCVPLPSLYFNAEHSDI